MTEQSPIQDVIRDAQTATKRLRVLQGLARTQETMKLIDVIIPLASAFELLAQVVDQLADFQEEHS